MQPPIRLIIIGGGPDSAPLADLARTLGWLVTIICQPGEAAGINDVSCCDAGHLPLVLRPDGRTVAVVKTHHYGRDFAFLRALLPLGLRYIGLVGSRKRKEQLVAALLDLGASLDATAAIHGPAGMDIGAESPEEIALSIIAEIQTVFSGRPRHSLRDRKGPIHPRTDAAAHGAVQATSVPTV